MNEAKRLNRIPQLDPERASGKTKQLFDDVESRLGGVPNLFRVLGNAPVALEGYLNFSAALAGGRLDARVREQIALTVAESNLCGYALSAHAYLGRKIGLSRKDIADAIRASAADGKTDAILKLPRSIVVQRGEASDSELQRARVAGLTDGDIMETVANFVLNIFTNYINLVARTVVDFPQVKSGAP
jgi:AhpD family alkylhydroperoxidase